MVQPKNVDANGQPQFPGTPPVPVGGADPVFDYGPARAVSGPGSAFADPKPAAADDYESDAEVQDGGRRRRKSRRSRKGGMYHSKGGMYHSKGGMSHRKSRRSRKGGMYHSKGGMYHRKGGKKTRKATRRTRGHRGGGIIGTYLSDATANLQGVVQDLNSVLKDDQARRAITAEQAKLMTAKRQVAAATQSTYKALSGAAAKLVGKPGTGRAVALLQQAANSQPQTRNNYFAHSFIRP